LRDDVRESVFVENVEEGTLGFAKDAFEPAGGCDLAGAADSVLAVDDLWVFFSEVEEFAETDFFCRAGEADSASTAALSFQKSMPDEILADLGDVVDGESVCFSYFTCRYEPVLVEDDVDETSIEEVGVGIELHTKRKIFSFFLVDVKG